MLRYTAKVRRGFALMVARNLRTNADLIIAKATDPSTPRDRRMTRAEISDFLAAIDWIIQEAHTCESSPASPSSTTTPSTPSPPPAS